MLHLRAFALVIFGLVLLLGLTRWGDPPKLLVDVTPAAVLECAPIRPAPVPCGKSCVRLMSKGAIA